MHPMVKPALTRAWRDLQHVQFGVAPAHAVVLGPVDTTTGSLIDLFDGTRGMPLLRAEARALGVPEETVDALVGRLARAGLLDDPACGGPEVEALRAREGVLDRLRADLASLAVVHPEPGAGLRRLGARGALRVQVRGAGRVGAAIAALLSGSGVGEVEVLDGGTAEPWDVAPGGLPGEAVGERRSVAARRVVARAAPGRRPRSRAGERGEPERPLDLVVFAPRDGLDAYAPDPGQAEPWIASGTPHLYAGVVEATGVVGPLVLPGGTGCAECVERARAEREPVWPVLRAQWRSGRRRSVPACDLALASTVAGTAAAHALAFLDGDLPDTVGARWEAALPLLDWRREAVAPHRDCACGAAGQTGREGTSRAGAPHDTMAG
ncbi:ThiF family adenylyltransferase [Streptomyces sp. NPDC001941]|uniref:ThiF family adenylyltransferase n=1 Tax=Streptomyces sp. NPDC001941 TaxID=3154659 RepID=UPI00332D7040